MKMRTLLLSIAIGLVAIAMTPLVLVRSEAHTARQLMGVVEELRVGSEGARVIPDLLEVCGSHCSLKQGSCSEGSCDILFMFDNSALSRFHVVRFTRFSGGITLREKAIESVAFDYSTHCRGTQFFGLSVRDALGAQFPLQVSTGPIGKPATLSFRITPDISPDQKSGLYNLDFGCFSRSCSTIAELAPSLESSNLLAQSGKTEYGEACGTR